ncbi:hypothetical protein EfmJHP10_28670 [Enterococcus faecium]|nr:hypothetical protein EfmJHP10_28670 [Enterococcus faecium]
MDFNKKFFWEISDLSCFVESERLSNGNNSVLNEYDKVVINKVKSLCEEARESLRWNIHESDKWIFYNEVS